MINIESLYSIWRNMWVNFFGYSPALYLYVPGNESPSAYAFDFVRFGWYLIWVVLLVWVSTLAIHVFVDLWEVDR